MYNRLKILIGSALILLVGLTACIKESPGEEITVETGDIELYFDAGIVASDSPATRGITAASETLIETLDVLVFEAHSDGTLTYVHHMGASDLSDVSGKPLLKRFRASIQTSEYNGDATYQLFFVANYRKQLIKALENVSVGESRDDVFDKITFQILDYYFINSSDVTALPMWGESQGRFKINKETNGMSIPIVLVRSVARMDIGLNMDSDNIAQGLGGKFILEEVRILNSSLVGQIGMSEGTYSWVSSGTETNITGTSASEPSSNTVISYLPYMVPTGQHGLTGNIYMAEAANLTRAVDDRLNVVIKGIYYGGDQPPRSTWYKLDIYADMEQNSSWREIIRNKLYRINIIDVNGIGYPHFDDAVSNPSTNSVAIEVVHYDDDGELRYVVLNNSYKLAVSTKSINITSAYILDQFYVSTDYEGSWLYEFTDSPQLGGNPVGWAYRRSSETCGVNTKDLFTVLFDDIGSCYLHITAGTLRQVIEVTRTGAQGYNYKVMSGHINGHEFNKSGEWINLTVTGTWPALDFRASANNEPIGISQSLAAGNGTNTSVKIYVPANNYSYYRTVILQWSEDGGNTWNAIAAGAQEPVVNYTVTSTMPDGYTVNRYGESFEMTVKGSYPDLYLRAATELGAPISDVVMIPANNTQQTVTIDVRNNGRYDIDHARGVYLQASTSSTFESVSTIDVNTGKQYPGTPLGPLQSTGRRVALSNASTGTVTWANSMGVSSSYNSSYLAGVGIIGSDYLITNSTVGCGSYEETGYPKGGWRLPTVEEMREINEIRGDLVGMGIGEYWTSTQTSDTTAIAFYINIVPYERSEDKTVNLVRAPRCVWDGL